MSSEFGPQVTVVGCGVIGLTTATVLRARGFDAHVVAAELPFDTVSIVAGAIWGPTSVGPQHRTAPWALRTHAELTRLVDEGAAGVAPMVHVDRDRGDGHADLTRYGDLVRRLGPDEAPHGFEHALEINGFRIDPPHYLRDRIDRFEADGGTITLQSVAALHDVPGRVVVNASGLGAVGLVGDDSMYPIRGQTIAVANPGIVDGFADETDPDRIIYVYPRTDQVVLGGTRQIGSDRVDADPTVRNRILEDTARLDPRVDGLEIIEERVGLRPGRPEVRLDVDVLADGRPVVHNYGHAGSGYILSWGCAHEVADLVAGLDLT